MSREDVVLHFEIADHELPDAEAVARAVIAWTETARAALQIVDPDSDPRIELAGVEPGSDVFRLVFRKLAEAGQRIEAGGKEYPLVANAAVSLATGIVGGAVLAIGSAVIAPSPRIPDDQMKVFQEMNRNIAASVEVQRRRQEFYSIILPEPAITAVEVQRGVNRERLYRVPRSEFATGSGLWTVTTAQPEQVTRPGITTWEVVLIRPAAVGKPRRWTFARDGLEFSATMSDPLILQAIAAGTWHIEIAEGVRMRVQMEYKEQLEGGVWRQLPESRKITKVLDPLPPPPSTPLFPAPSHP